MVGKCKYMIHSIITKLFSVLMNRFLKKKWGPFLLSTTDSSPDENGPIFPGFTQLGSGKIAMDYRLRKNILLRCALSLFDELLENCFHLLQLNMLIFKG